MSETQRRAWIYARQSEDSKTSIEEQLAIGHARLAAEGWTLVEAFAEGVSASRHAGRKRDLWPKLLAGVEHEDADLIWLWESSRGDRTLSTWAALLESCQRHGVVLCVESHDARLYDMNVPRDWKTMAEDGVDSAYESDKTALRTRRDAAKYARKGMPHGKQTYGYRHTYKTDEEGRWVLTKHGRRILTGQEPDPAEAPVVRKIFAMIAAGESLRAITAELNRLRLEPGGDLPSGAPTRKGGPWGTSTVRSIALNPAYIGKRVHDPNRRGDRAGVQAAVYDANPDAWPPLVDAETFHAATRVLTDPKRTTTRPGRAKHLLSMIARCGVCGAPMTVAYPRSTGKVAIYHCRGRGCVSADQDSLDRYVLAEVLGGLAHEATWKRLTAADPTKDEALSAARGELAGLQADYDEALSLFGAGEISARAFAAVEPGKLARVEAARAKLAELETPPALQFLRGDKDIEERWKAAPLSAKRAVIRALVTVTVDRSPVRGHRVGAEERTRVEPVA